MTDFARIFLRPYVSGKVRFLIDTLVEHFGGEAKWVRCLMTLNSREGDGSTPAG
jgi:hypothetical protein